MLKFISKRFTSESSNEGGPARKLTAATRAVMEPVEARIMMSTTPATVLNQQVGTITAKYETQPLPQSGEAASDPTVWVNPTDSSLSTIIGTDKFGGIGVYDLTGNQLQFITTGSYLKVDTRSNFTLGGKSVSIVAAGRVDTNSLSLFAIDPTTRQLTDVTGGTIKLANGGVIDGVTMYQSAETGKTYAFVSSDTGVIEQFELNGNSAGLITAKSVRTIKVGSAAQGMTADDETGSLYVSQDGVAIWKYGAEPTDGAVRVQIDNSDSGSVGSDSESLALYKGSNGAGYLIAARQNTNDYVIYDRQTGAYVTKFKISNGAVDGTSSSDGIAVTSASLGNGLSDGAFIVEDDKNDIGNQNYKIVSWGDIAGAQAIPLAIDVAQQPPAVAPASGSVNNSATIGVTSLSLYQANSTNNLATLTNGSVINLSDYQGLGLNVKADTRGTIGSIKFGLNGTSNYHIENYATYDLAGTAGVWVPSVGTYTITATAYSDHNAKGIASTAYSVTFTVVDDSTASDPSVPKTAAPGAITSLTATGTTPTQITVQWKSSDKLADGYKIDRSTDGVNFKKVATTTATSYSDNSVVTATVYTYRVTAYNNIGTSDVSDVASATVTSIGLPTPDPDAPTDRPSASTTGVKAGSKLTSVSNFKASSNTTYSNLQISGQVTLTGMSNVTFINCIIDGGGSSRYGIRCDDCTNITIKNCEIVNVSSAGIFGDHFKAIGNFIHQSAGDGIKPISDALIQGNYVTQLGWFSPDAHADGVQIRGGANFTIVGNFFDIPNGVVNTKCNSALFVQLTASEIRFDGNWVCGGNFAIHAYSDTPGANTSIEITSNVFYSGSTKFGFGSIGTGVVWASNVTDSGSVALNSTK